MFVGCCSGRPSHEESVPSEGEAVRPEAFSAPEREQVAAANLLLETCSGDVNLATRVLHQANWELPKPESTPEPEPPQSKPEDTTHGGAALTHPTDTSNQLSRLITPRGYRGGDDGDDCQSLPTAAEFCGPTTGISLDGLQHLIEMLGPQLTAETATSDVCHAFIKPMTTPDGWADEATLTDAAKRWYKHTYVHRATGERRKQTDPPAGTRSLCVLWSAAGAATAHMVGKPTHFLSHAWTYKFLNLVEALRSFVASQPEGSAPVFFWFDCFSIDEHATQSLPREWWGSTFKEAIRMIGQTVMMISPWSEPLPLMRAWCIWELYCTESVGAPFAVCLGPAEQDALEAAILGNSSGYERVLAAFAAVDVGSAEAGNERDKVMIMEHAERSEGGLQGLNATAVSTLRRWFVEFVKGLGRRVRAHRDAAEGVFQMTVVAHVLNSMGEQLEALQLYETVTAIREAETDGDEVNTAVAQANLANTLQRLKRHAEARPLLETVLAIFSRRLGTTHEDTLKTRTRLANCKRNLGDADGARGDYEAVLAAMTTAIGPTHAETLKTQLNLAISYHGVGGYDRAARELEAVVDGYRATLGLRHADTLFAQAHLGNVRRLQGDAVGAVAMLEVAAPGLEAQGHFRAANAREMLEEAQGQAAALALPEL
jgi:tetratricopeptide (TPR) repeat protein